MAKKGYALITGASAGFGWAISKQLARAGYHVILNARRKDRLEKLQAEIQSESKVDVKIAAFDVSKIEECEKAASQGLLSNIEVLVNNAGLAKGTDPIENGKWSDWNPMIDTNVKGLLAMTRLVLPGMIERNSGHIVNIGSVAGRWTYPGGAVYSATKFAVRAISDSIRMDLLGKNIRVTNIEPGMAETEFSMVRFEDKEKAKKVYQGMKPLSPDDIADIVSWCVMRPAHVNIQELVVMPTDQAAIQMVHRGGAT